MLARLKDSFLQSNVAKTATASAVALSLTFGAANIANADNVQPASLQEIIVPMNDSRGIERDAIQSLAAMASNKAQTIVLYGPTNRSFQEVTEGARASLASRSSALNGVIVASGEPEIAFYADGQLTATMLLRNTNLDIDSRITEQLEADYERVIAPRMLAANQVALSQ